MGPKAVWSILSLFRLLWCLLPQTGYLHPDEFFQSPEVMAGDILHLQVFRPWEFLLPSPCRSVVSPFVTSGVSFWVIRSLQQLGILNNPPSSYSLLVLPRFFVTLSSFLLDLCVYHVAPLWGADRWPALALLAGSYVTTVFYTRTWSNAIEGLLFALLLLMVSPNAAPGSLAIPHHSRGKHSSLLGVLLVIGFFNRPTFPAFAVVPVLCWAGQVSQYDVVMMIKELLKLIPSASVTAILLIVADTLYFTPPPCQKNSTLSVGWNAVLTPLNFLAYNVNPCHLAQHGTHPRLNHLLVNGMLLFGILHLSALSAVLKSCIHCLCQLSQVIHTHQMPPLAPRAGPVPVLLLFYVVPLALLSMFSHQEPRFLIPLILPLVLLRARGGKTVQWKSAIVCFNVCGAIFFGVLHQGGLVPALCHLEKVVRSESQQKNVSSITLLFTHTYMPPRFLLSIPHQNTLVEVIDIAGAEEQVLCQKLAELADRSCFREQYAFLDRVNNTPVVNSAFCRQQTGHVLVITPGTVQPAVEKCGFAVQRESSWFPHVSLEDPPQLASLYNDNWLDLLGLHMLQLQL
ncbi:GPI alpha-1,2-mannosyltransferase 4 [Microcaecilia unicolor]|uniref:Mannosyltransferase n=1 Tax=Microcaecilia unicolor TaxID=1415580 RepID=A0A6P7YBX6_9AMPH|nr:GPI mannosyltransferase 4 [Microcaecilia unicolor]